MERAEPSAARCPPARVRHPQAPRSTRIAWQVPARTHRNVPPVLLFADALFFDFQVRSPGVPALQVFADQLGNLVAIQVPPVPLSHQEPPVGTPRDKPPLVRSVPAPPETSAT